MIELIGLDSTDKPKLYRYDYVISSKRNSVIEQLTLSIEPNTKTVSIVLNTYDIIRQTNCGVWIDNYGTDKFVNLKARKQYACETKAEAKKSFIARKNKQLKILTNQIENITLALSHIKNNP